MQVSGGHSDSAAEKHWDVPCLLQCCTRVLHTLRNVKEKEQKESLPFQFNLSKLLLALQIPVDVLGRQQQSFRWRPVRNGSSGGDSAVCRQRLGPPFARSEGSIVGASLHGHARECASPSEMSSSSTAYSPSPEPEAARHNLQTQFKANDEAQDLHHAQVSAPDSTGQGLQAKRTTANDSALRRYR